MTGNCSVCCAHSVLYWFSKLWKMRARASNNPAGVEVSLKMAAEYPVCVHGTWWKAWEDMKKKGISRLGRNPIHFCSGMIGRGMTVASRASLINKKAV